MTTSLVVCKQSARISRATRAFFARNASGDEKRRQPDELGLQCSLPANAITCRQMPSPAGKLPNPSRPPDRTRIRPANPGQPGRIHGTPSNNATALPASHGLPAAAADHRQSKVESPYSTADSCKQVHMVGRGQDGPIPAT